MAATDLPDTFTYKQAIEAGLSGRQVYALRDSGQVETIGRGLYRRAGAPMVDHDLLVIAERATRPTICLLSALARHDLTDAIPAAYDVAVPRGSWRPHLDVPVKWHAFATHTYDIGRESLTLDHGTTVGVYDAPRTIVDAYRLQDIVGLDVAHEALRRWLRKGGQPARLMRTAKHFPRTQRRVLTAVETLL